MANGRGRDSLARRRGVSREGAEADPLERWFSEETDVRSDVAIAEQISEFIERRRPGWGRFVLLTGCCGAAYAVYKGFNLYMGHDDHPSGGDD